ncbi:MAG: hypothetical protein ACK4TJ_00170 [Tabrizicola sp.]
MCNRCTVDPRDELVYAARALGAVADLVGDLERGGCGFERTRPGELGELLDIIHERIDQAALRLQDYVPRD